MDKTLLSIISPTTTTTTSYFTRKYILISIGKKKNELCTVIHPRMYSNYTHETKSDSWIEPETQQQCLRDYKCL